MKHESKLNKITIWLIVISLAVVLFNSYQIGKLKEGAAAGGSCSAGSCYGWGLLT